MPYAPAQAPTKGPVLPVAPHVVSEMKTDSHAFPLKPCAH